MDTPMAPPMDIAGATPANTQTDAGQSMPAQGGGLGSAGFNPGAAQTNTAPGGHAKLFNMLQMMGVALSATGKAIATHGREGGEPDVAAFQEQQQREQIATQQAAQQKQEGDLRMKALQAQTNQMVLDTNTKALMAPAEIRDKVTQAQSNYAKFLTDDLHLNPVVATAMMQGQDFGQHLDAVHQGLNNNLTDNTIVPSYGQGKAGGEGGHTMGFSFQDLKQTQVPKELIPSALASFTPVIEQAKAMLGANDPRVQAAQGVVDNMSKASSVTAYDVQVLGYNNIMQPLMAAMSAKQGVMDFQKKQAETTTAQNQAKESAVPKSLDDAVGRMSQAQVAYRNSPTPENKQALTDAKTARQDFLDADAAKARVAQQVQEGDPAQIGQALAQGLFAPSQLLSTRNMSKPFYTNVLKAADDASMKATGQHFNAAKAEAQYKYATNPSTQNTLNMVDALGEPGGVADILLEKGKGLSNTGVPSFNSWKQALDYQSGGKSVPAYMPAAVDFADMYAKIMGGGQGSDTARLQALNLVLAAQTPDQRQAAVSTLKETMVARKHQMVRDNPVLKAMYPDQPDAQAQSTGANSGGSFNPNAFPKAQ